MATEVRQPAAGERVAKAIARAGLASRRAAEAWIAAGRVAVNGRVITSPALDVTESDRVTVDGEPLPVRERTRLFLYHKPRGLMTTHADPAGRPTIFDALPRHLPRLVSVGRLDVNTEGLLLLTNDGGLARALELPATGWLRRYRVRAHGRIGQSELDGLRSGLVLEGVRYGAIEATLEREQGSNVWLSFAIREGKNREVKNVLGHLGLAVNRLIRVSFGPFQLGELRPGEVAEVRTRTLREQLGPRLAARAAVDLTGPRSERATSAVTTKAPQGGARIWRKKSEDGEEAAAPHGHARARRGHHQFARHKHGVDGTGPVPSRHCRSAAGAPDRNGADKRGRDSGNEAGRAAHGQAGRTRKRQRDPERIGAPERARLEKRRRRRPRGKGR
jgi:23S rRNA pseudouridine2605 synthase